MHMTHFAVYPDNPVFDRILFAGIEGILDRAFNKTSVIRVHVVQKSVI